jgi:tripartite-type tricarboxylate transporter receptor subunit TctC
MRMFRALAITALAAAVSAAFATQATAQATYPDKPVMMIVPFAAGGASDVIARLVSEEMGKFLGQRIINENVAGAGGATALTRFSRAAADGYTILIGNSGTNAANYHLAKDLAYKPESFVGVGLVAKTIPVIVAKKDFGPKNLAETIAFAKANPGKLTVGHAGVGSSNFIICKSLLAATGMNVTMVGYRGGALALQDVMAGNIDLACDNATSAAGAIKAGQVRGLVASAAARLPGLPDVPTATEAGSPAFQAQGWNGIFVPAGTPAPVIARLEAAIRAAVASDLVKQRFGELDTVLPEAAEMTPAFMATFVPAEIRKYGDILKE